MILLRGFGKQKTTKRINIPGRLHPGTHAHAGRACVFAGFCIASLISDSDSVKIGDVYATMHSDSCHCISIPCHTEVTADIKE
jgi:hypothetical protein